MRAEASPRPADPGSRPVAGRSATATSESMDVTAGRDRHQISRRRLFGLLAAAPVAAAQGLAIATRAQPAAPAAESAQGLSAATARAIRAEIERASPITEAVARPADPEALQRVMARASEEAFPGERTA